MAAAKKAGFADGMIGDDASARVVSRKTVVTRWVLLVVAVVAVAAALIFLPIRLWLMEFLEWVNTLGVWGPAVVVLFYIVACIFWLPGSLITIGAGFAFGVVWGTVTVSVGSTLGAVAAFLVGRFIARDWVGRKVAANPKFAAIDDAVADQGFVIVLLTRLSPLFPFNMLNYGYGLTKVSLGTYALASWIGMLPGTVMYVYVGSLAKAATEVASESAARSTVDWFSYAVGFVVAVVVAVYVTRVARRALRERVGFEGMEEEQSSEPTTGEEPA